MSDVKCEKCGGLAACWCSPLPGVFASDPPPTPPVVEEMPEWLSKRIAEAFAVKIPDGKSMAIMSLSVLLQSSQQRAEDEKRELERIRNLWDKSVIQSANRFLEIEAMRPVVEAALALESFLIDYPITPAFTKLLDAIFTSRSTQRTEA